MRKFILVVATAALSMGLAAPAMATPTGGDTTATFTLTSGDLTISAPASSNFGSGLTGTASLSGSLGAVSVSDGRGLLNGGWAAYVATTAFTTGGATSAETIENTHVGYSAGAATATTGTGVFAPLAGGVVNGTVGAFTGSALVGNNSAAWNPTISIDVPAAAVFGTYSATVTHSVL